MAQVLIKTGQEAEQAALAIRDGVQQEDGSYRQLHPQEKQVLLGALRQYSAERQMVVEDVRRRESEGEEVPDGKITTVIDRTVNPETGEVDEEGFMSDLLRRTGGAFQVGSVLATSAIAEPAAGVSAAAATIYGAFDKNAPSANDAAVEVYNAVTDALTFQPRTQTGQEMLNGLIKPLAKIEEGADWIASTASFGNPYAATAIKTSLLGGMELAGFKGAGRVRIPANLQKIMTDAERLGITLDPANFQASVLEAAERMSPDQRAANAGFLQEAMRLAKEEARTAVKGQFAQARQGRAFVQVSEFEPLAKSMADDLLEHGFDFGAKGMEDVARRLQEIQELGSGTARPGGTTPQILGADGQPVRSTKNITQRFQDLELIRRRLVQDAKSGTPSARTAANKMKSMIDDWIDHQLANDLIDGDPATIKAWKDARIMHSDYMKNFNNDRAIKNLIEKDATPEQVRAWLTGMNSIGARANAGATLDRIMKVLGKDHPAIEGIRQDLLFEVAEPLLREQPNWNGFLNNYNRLIRNNPTLVNQLGIKESNIAKLTQFATTAKAMGPNNALFDKTLFTRALATFFVGHQLARKALAVSFTRKIGHIMLGVSRTTKKGILADITDATFGKPILPRNKSGAAFFIASSALSMADEQIERDKEKARAVEADRKKAVEGQNLTL